jgi:hypothetical protein
VNNSKVIALVVGAIFALFVVWMVVRMFVLSQYGFGASPIFYMGLPIGGITVVVLLLLRLGLLNFGNRPGTGNNWQQPGGWQAPPQYWQQPGGAQMPPQPWEQPGGAQIPPQPWQQPGGWQAPPQPWQQPGGAQMPPPAVAPPPLSVSQRLQELETLRTTGAISDTEYAAKRREIISTM